MDFGNRLKRIIDAQGISQYALAKKLECSQSIISSYISGGKKPSLDTLEYICAKLGLTISEFFSEESDLQDGERQVLTSYRQLPPEKQELALRLIRAL